MIYVVILAYNEADSLGELVSSLDRELKPLGDPLRLVVVDDGSLDRTAAVAESLSRDFPLTLLRHPVNQGVAKAFDTGLRHVAGQASADDAVVTMEGDRTNDPACAPAMIRKLKEGFDVVCASRYRPGGGYVGFPLKRWILSRAANALARLFFHIPGVRDYTLFFKGYRVEAVRAAIQRYGDRFIQCRGFASNAEILVKVCRGEAVRCAEVPTVYRYDLKPSPSRMRVGKNLAEYFELFWRAIVE